MRSEWAPDSESCPLGHPRRARGGVVNEVAPSQRRGGGAVLENGQPGESGDGRVPCGRAVTPRCNAKTFSPLACALRKSVIARLPDTVE